MSNEFKQHGVVIGGKKYVTNDYGKFVLVEEEETE